MNARVGIFLCSNLNILTDSHGYFDFFDRQFGLLTPWSHVPHTVSVIISNL